MSIDIAPCMIGSDGTSVQRRRHAVILPIYKLEPAAPEALDEHCRSGEGSNRLMSFESGGTHPKPWALVSQNEFLSRVCSRQSMVTGKEIGETNRTMNALALSLLLSACGTVTSPVHRHDFGNLGRFEFRVAEPAMKGIVVGAPHSGNAVVSAILARAVSDRTGAGLVAAYGFKSKRIAVAQPLVVRTSSYQIVPDNAARPGSVFREFKEILHDIAEGEIDLYIEFRGRPATGRKDNLQVVASGFTFEESRIIKQSYLEIRDRVIAGRAAAALSLSMSPLEEIGWNATGIRHHGVLLGSQTGLEPAYPGEVL